MALPMLVNVGCLGLQPRLLLSEAEKARSDAKAEALCTACTQKAHRQQERQAGVNSRGDDDLEARPNAVTSTRNSSSNTLQPDNEDDNNDHLSTPHHQQQHHQPVPLSPCATLPLLQESSPEHNAYGSPAKSSNQSITPSCSPSPAAGEKCQHDDEDSTADVAFASGFVKAQKISDHSGCPKASDYEDIVKERSLL
ncbi:hypothetical protein BYT27DRAFT_7218158 [Phlegmacium glaucopus]|nr:hypothetical protein BYT27DRAFT_7218158 [Phlegmacium glaucopus]